MMKSLVLLFLSISTSCFAVSLEELRCPGEDDCFSRQLTLLEQVEDEIFQSLNTQLFPDLFRYDAALVSFCDHENKYCNNPAIWYYQQRDTGEKLLVIGSINNKRQQRLSLLSPRRQKQRLYHVRGAFFSGYHLTALGLEIRTFRCSTDLCREQAQVFAGKQSHDEH